MHTLGPDGGLAVWTDRDLTAFDATGGASLADGGSVIHVYEVP